MSNSVVVLTVKSQKASGEKVFQLNKKRVVLGSSTSSDVRLVAPEVSSIHAILEISGIDGKPVVYDLASETGVQVNGKTTVQATLEPSDRIQIGPYLISIKIQNLSDSLERSSVVKEAFGQKLFLNPKEDFAPLLLEHETTVHDIFDHKTTASLSLQVVMFYHDTILEIENFVDKRRIIIGPGKKDDFSIPPFLGAGQTGRFELVTNESGQYFLHLNNMMGGVINSAGRLTAVKDLPKKAYPLSVKDFAKVKLNDVSFFLSFTDAPPRLKFPRLLKRDPLFAKTWFTSLFFTTAILIILSSITVDPKIEIEQLPERVATIIYEPRFLPVERPPQQIIKTPTEAIEKLPKKITIQETPRPVTQPPGGEIGKKEEQAKKPSFAQKLPTQSKKELAKLSGREGQGAKAIGKEGGRGKPSAPKAEIAQNKALRPGAKTSAATAGVSPGRSQTDSLGVVDVFKEAKGTLSKIFAGGKGAANSAARLEGYSGFTTYGQGGLGAAGSGKGGGGTSLGLGGLSDKGAGGGKRGQGLGALGEGGNMLGSSGKVWVQSGGIPEPIVLGGIDEDAIRRAIDQHRDEIKYCYEKEISAENPDLAGRIGLRWVIGPSGGVTSAGVVSTSLKNVNVEGCVVDVIKRIQFPPVRGGGIAEVSYPFVFKPSTK